MVRAPAAPRSRWVVQEIVNSAVIRAPAEKIFDFLCQAERNVEWVPDLSRSERVTAGPTQRGTRFQFVMRVAGIPVDVTDEVVAFDPPRVIGFRGVRGLGHSGSWTLEPLPAVEGEPARTQVTYRMAFEMPPGIGPLVARVMSIPARLDDQSRACLANLRRILE